MLALNFFLDLNFFKQNKILVQNLKKNYKTEITSNWSKFEQIGRIKIDINFFHKKKLLIDMSNTLAKIKMCKSQKISK